ncbi:SRPBCC domain-containing protein [Mucilaginibacter sp. BJC16-A38]|uniref:SRPBCC domain-containing protein n=1 Tax=Mucilaginibacter phenanthrenivorans TaxID=1234842 RepID=UPI00215807BF|nr:SRPBCC domain-containing protein [Mucilaginibacter phenanthrenivorans]MCR8557631.1 SRPBCC domain-containing protein [Mucilaginibacter phenanthrenivorans]
MENKKSSTHDRELHITRTLNAPVELVWEAWSKPEHIANWWGPNDFTTTISTMDMVPGGEWNLVMHGPDGKDYINKSIFKEIIPLKKIVYEHTSYPWILATIDFEERGEQTFISWHMLFASHEDFIEVVKVYKADVGQRQNVDKLEVYLEGMSNQA